MDNLVPRLRTAEYLITRDRIEAELDNVRAALEWSLPIDGSDDEGDVTLGFRLCHAMTWFWYAGGYPEEGRRWLERATGRMKGEGPEEIGVLHGLAVLLLQQGEAESAQRMLIRCLDYWRARDDDREIAKELNSLAVAYRTTGDHDNARSLLQEGITRAERSDDKNPPGGLAVQSRAPGDRRRFTSHCHRPAQPGGRVGSRARRLVGGGL